MPARDRVLHSEENVSFVDITEIYANVTDFVEIDGEMKSKGRRRCWCFPYVNLEDVIEQGEDATNYAYECDPQSEIMGYFVSDDEYTQQNIYL